MVFSIIFSHYGNKKEGNNWIFFVKLKRKWKKLGKNVMWSMSRHNLGAMWHALGLGLDQLSVIWPMWSMFR